MHLHVRTPLLYLANGWADCVQTWCVASDSLDERLTQVRCGVHLHVRTCTPPPNDGASSPARPSPIKASYWFDNSSHHFNEDTPLSLGNFHMEPIFGHAAFSATFCLLRHSPACFCGYLLMADSMARFNSSIFLFFAPPTLPECSPVCYPSKIKKCETGDVQSPVNRTRDKIILLLFFAL